MLTFRQFYIVEEILTPKNSLQLSREEMPQIAAIYVPEFLEFLKSHNISHKIENVPATSLKASQKEIDGDRVRALDGTKHAEKPMIISKDDYIIDGHHRWMNAVWNNDTLNVVRVDANIHTLLDLAHKFPKSFCIDMNHEFVAS